MLMVNQLIGFGAGRAVVRVLGSIIVGGTDFGDMTGGGGLDNAFDGNTNQTSAASAKSTSAPANFTTFIGRSSAARIFKVICNGSNNHGYVDNINPTVTLEMRAQVGGSAPTTDAEAAANGVSLGTLAFTDTSNESGNPREIISLNNETLFDHRWIVETHNGAANHMSMTEASFYESV